MYVCMLNSFVINKLLRLFGISLGRDKVYLVNFNHLKFFFSRILMNSVIYVKTFVFGFHKRLLVTRLMAE